MWSPHTSALSEVAVYALDIGHRAQHTHSNLMRKREHSFEMGLRTFFSSNHIQTQNNDIQNVKYKKNQPMHILPLPSSNSLHTAI